MFTFPMSFWIPRSTAEPFSAAIGVVVIISHQQLEDFAWRSIMFMVGFSFLSVSDLFLQAFLQQTASFPLIPNYSWQKKLCLSCTDSWGLWDYYYTGYSEMLRYHTLSEFTRQLLQQAKFSSGCTSPDETWDLALASQCKACGLLLAMAENHIYWATAVSKVNRNIPLTFLWWDLAQLMHPIR